MRRFVAALLALLAACSPASWTDESPDALKAVHDAVFDVYFPVDVLPIDDVIKRGAFLLREESWQQFKLSGDLLRLLWTLEHRTGDPVFSKRPREAGEA